MVMRALMLAALLGACGGGPSEGADEARRRTSAGGEACPRDRARLGGTCWTASGTRWRVQADGPGGDYRFELSLLAAGRARAGDHSQASPARDEWFQQGSTLRIFLSDRFVEYRTTVTNGTVLIGEAINVRGQRWSWRADRSFGDVPCDGEDARTDDGCMTVNGTRWRLAADGSDERLIEFLDGGRLAAGRSQGRWEQSGSALTFTLEEGGAEYIALIASATELSGRFSGGDDGAFSARRITSIPPVMHE